MVDQETQYGVILPADLSLPDIVTFAQQAERMGFDFVGAYDQTVLTSTSVYSDPEGNTFSVLSTGDPLTVLTAVAERTKEIELFTCVLVLPQRPTVLVARQAADVDIVSNGRLRLGVGAGWDKGVFQAYGRGDIFETRGKDSERRGRGNVMDQQIDILRQLWTQPEDSTTTATVEVWQDPTTADVHGENILEARLDPLPVQQPIPIFVGGESKSAFERAAKKGDGMISFDLSYRWEEIPRKKALLQESLEKEGRDVNTFPFMVNANLVTATREIFTQLARLEDNFSHLIFNTIDETRQLELKGHINLLRYAQRQLGLR